MHFKDPVDRLGCVERNVQSENTLVCCGYEIRSAGKQETIKTLQATIVSHLAYMFFSTHLHHIFFLSKIFSIILSDIPYASIPTGVTSQNFIFYGTCILLQNGEENGNNLAADCTFEQPQMSGIPYRIVLTTGPQKVYQLQFFTS